jgi:glycosyltransferase involved in cell wall biosynthesis
VKILQVHNQYRQPGGEDTVATTEANLLREAGHTVIEHRERNPDGNLAAAGDLLRAPWNPRAAGRIGDLVRQHRPDVTHIHNTWYHLTPSVFRAARAAGSPTVLTLHNYRLVCANSMLLRDGKPCELCVGSRNPWYAVRYRCYRDSTVQSAAAAATIAINRRRSTWQQDVDLFLALTDFARGKMIEGGLPEQRIRVKPNFVSDPGRRTVSTAESDLILFVGRLAPEKGPDVLVEAWQRANLEGLRLEIIGDGDMRETLGGRPGVALRGQLGGDQVRKLMLQARALVLPSIWYEGLSMVMLEALGAGLPVLASALGAMPDVLHPLGESWLVDPGDPGALADRLRGLRDNDLVGRAGVSARALFDSQYSPSVGLAGLENAYRHARGEVSGEDGSDR